jgi:hypothetical protein
MIVLLISLKYTRCIYKNHHVVLLKYIGWMDGRKGRRKGGREEGKH